MWWLDGYGWRRRFNYVHQYVDLQFSFRWFLNWGNRQKPVWNLETVEYQYIREKHWLNQSLLTVSESHDQETWKLVRAGKTRNLFDILLMRLWENSDSCVAVRTYHSLASYVVDKYIFHGEQLINGGDRGNDLPKKVKSPRLAVLTCVICKHNRVTKIMWSRP